MWLWQMHGEGPFVWEGQDYLLKMCHDTAFLAQVTFPHSLPPLWEVR